MLFFAFGVMTWLWIGRSRKGAVAAFKCQRVHQSRGVQGLQQCLTPSTTVNRRVRSLMEAFPRKNIYTTDFWNSKTRFECCRMSTLTKTAVRRMRVADMRMELAFRGMDTNGNRGVLLTRLLAIVDDSRQDEQGLSTENLETSIAPERLYVLRTKGHTTKNSGGTGVGLVLYDTTNDKEVWSGCLYLVGDRTSFEAEYTAIILGLEHIQREFGIKKIVVQNSNDAVVQQIRGLYKINKPELRFLHGFEKEVESSFQYCSAEVVPSKENIEAQGLAQSALATQKSIGMKLKRGVKDPLFRIPPEVYTVDMDDSISNNEATTFLNTEALTPPTFSPLEEDNLVNDEVEEAFSEFPPLNEFGAETSPTVDPSQTYLLRFDGGSRGNPGNAGAGMVLYDEAGSEIWNGWKHSEKDVTNNVAEYLGLLCGMKEAASFGVKRLIVEGDSQLVVKQLNGEYRCRDPKLKEYFSAVRSVCTEFKHFEIRHIMRAENSRADELANRAMDMQASGGLTLSHDVL